MSPKATDFRPQYFPGLSPDLPTYGCKGNLILCPEYDLDNRLYIPKKYIAVFCLCDKMALDSVNRFEFGGLPFEGFCQGIFFGFPSGFVRNLAVIPPEGFKTKN